MNKKILSLILLSLLLLAAYVPIASAHNAPFPSTYDPTNLVVDTVGEPWTLDPAWCYDSASGEVISNVYETMLFYDTVWTDGPYQAGKSDVFKSMLATEVSIVNGPAPYAKTFYFRIRSGTQIETFVANGNTGAVNLFKDGQIYGTMLFVRDPDYSKVGKTEGPITSPTAVPTTDGKVDRANVPPKAYTGQTGWDKLKDTTWTTVSSGYVIRGWKDANGNGALDAGEVIETVRRCSSLKGPWWNVREYWKVTAIDPRPTYTITVEHVPVKFHNGVELTPQDVEYSWERWLVQDRDGGAQWMFYYPMLGLYSALDPVTDPDFGSKIDNAIGSNATHAWVSLVKDFPEGAFFQILSQPGASVANRAWCVAKGDFDGDWTHGWQYIWDMWHNPIVSFIEGDMMGTGPYELDYWVQGSRYSIVRNDNYWDGWPAHVSPTSAERIADFVSRVTWVVLPSYLPKRTRFLDGTSDFTTIPRQYRDEILGKTVGGEKIRCFYPVEPQLSVSAAFFNFNINPSSPWLGPGFDRNNPHIIAEDRIPVDLFSDIHVRRGFTAAFDFDSYISSAFLGEATQPSSPVIDGVSYGNPASPKPAYNMTRAAEELKAAWIDHPNDDLATPDGALWDRGMNFTLLYITTSSGQGGEIVSILAQNVNSLNPKFHMLTREVAWGSTYLPHMVAGMLPLFSIGWLLDYPDPDNVVYPFMHSTGPVVLWGSQIYPPADRVDWLIEAGARMVDDTEAYNGELDFPDPRGSFNDYPNVPPDTRWPRRSIYYELQAIWVEQQAGFILYQPVGRHWEQAWIRGWYYNPVYPGNYFYHLWKAKTHFGDANNDGTVGVLDGATVSASWTKPAPDSALGPLGYKIQADLTGGTGGTTGSNSGPVEGIPDGKVGIADAALISAYWDGPPKGPKHP